VPGMDQLFSAQSKGSALDHDVLEAVIISKGGNYFGKVDGEPKLWGPVSGASDALIGTTVLIGISQNEKMWVISPIPVADVSAARARVTRLTDFPIPNINATNIEYDTERWDEGGLFNVSASNVRLTAPRAGLYIITLSCEWNANATGERELQIRENGTTVIAAVLQPAPATGTLKQTLTTSWYLDAGQYVTSRARQTSGGSLNVVRSANWSPEFAATRVSS